MNHKRSLKSSLSSLAFLLLAFLFIQACGTDDPAVENEVELINEVHLKFTPIGGGNEIEWVWKVEEGVSTPEVITAALAANTEYDMLVEFYGMHDHDHDHDHSKLRLNLADGEDDHDHGDEEMSNITAEIREESAEHQIFYQINPASLLSVEYEDQDVDGRPIGLICHITTGDAGTGSFQLIMRHDLNKAASGVAEGDITNAGGATDVDVTFENIVVQ